MTGPRIDRTVRNWPFIGEMGGKNCSLLNRREGACRGAEKQKGLTPEWCPEPCGVRRQRPDLDQAIPHMP